MMIRMTGDITLSDIHIYPIKSCAGIALTETHLDRFGPVGDRRWMIVDGRGAFLTQRSHARLCLIKPRVMSGGLSLQIGERRIDVAEPGEDAPQRHVVVWEDSVPARYAGPEVDAALTDFLDVECHLVFMPEDSYRRVDGLYATGGETVSFADGFPLLLISSASLAALNDRLSAPVPMDRFRPNLVVDGCEAFAEDRWQRIRIGAQELTVAKACSRCVIPSIEQTTAERDSEILRTLAAFRRREGAVYFGQNLLYDSLGSLAVGQSIEVIA
ncbi:MAG: MOSC N-terminal beta barrel domain-containing protein [Pseudomonadota bacterium]